MSKIHQGKPWPLGSTITSKGVNFSVAAPHAGHLELLLFNIPNDFTPQEYYLWSSNFDNEKLEKLGLLNDKTDISVYLKTMNSFSMASDAFFPFRDNIDVCS